MPRGSNYVNNNRGVSLLASKKNKTRMVECSYGAACTRKGCIYSHPPKTSKAFAQSNEPCMAYLAGICTFTTKTCRKRHPGDEESERLIAKYSSMNCRFGDSCMTNGCLYRHPSDEPIIEENSYSNNDYSYQGGNMNAPQDYQGYHYSNQQMQQPMAVNSDFQEKLRKHQEQQQYLLQLQQQQQSGVQDQTFEFTQQSYQYPAQQSSNFGASSNSRIPKANLMDAANWQYGGSAGGGVSSHNQQQQMTGIYSQAQNNNAPYNDEEYFQKQAEGVNVNAREFVPGNWGR